MDKSITYKGYCATIEYSDQDECLTGRISNISHPVTFRGESVTEIRHAFEKAVDAYLDDCARKKEAPEKPSESRRVVRVSPALHGILSMVAKNENKSVNTWLAETLNRKNNKKN